MTVGYARYLPGAVLGKPDSFAEKIRMRESVYGYCQ